MKRLKFLVMILIGMMTMAGAAHAQGIPGTFVGATAGLGGNTTLMDGGEFASATGNEAGMWFDGSNTTGNSTRSLRVELVDGGGTEPIPDSGGFRPRNSPGFNVVDAPIVTVIGGLTAGVEYDISVIFTAPWGSDEIAIGAGLSPEAVEQVAGVREDGDDFTFGSWFDEISELNPLAGGTAVNDDDAVPQVITNIAARVWGHPLGSTVADESGEIRVYVDHLMTSIFLSDATSYNGVSFSEVVAVPVLLGDVNLDETVNFLDISPFITALSSGSTQVEADVNEDDVVNFLDIAPFIGILSGQ